MTFHSLRSQCDTFSCNCNFFILMCQLYFREHFSSIVAFVYKPLGFPFNHLSIQLYSNVTTSTRNKFYKCTYIHLHLFHLKRIQYSTGTSLYRDSPDPLPDMRPYCTGAPSEHGTPLYRPPSCVPETWDPTVRSAC